MSTESSPHNLNADAIDRIQFSDIFDAENIQRMQDLFSTATGVASIITSPDGSPLTRPSNFCRLCNDIIRKTEAGLASCYKSDCIIGSMNASSAAIQPCLGCGLWDAGTRITVGGRHIANWMIGQVRNEQLDDQKMVKFADEIGVNREDFLGALQEVPVMQFAQFEKVTEMLVAFAGEISEKAYANYLLKIQIRERDKAADMLKKSEERFSLAMDATTDGLWDGDVVTGKVYYSPGYFRILGYEPNEFEYNLVEWQKMIHPDDLETALANNNACLNNEIKSLNVEYRMKAKDGSWRWILDRGKVVERDADGKALRMIGTHVDITERRKTDDMLRDERQLLRTLIDNIPDTIYAKDLSYRKTLANLAEMKFTGAKSETDVLGKDDFDLYPGALAEKFHADDQLVFETGMPLINKEGYVTDVNGNQRWMLSSKLPLKDKSGRVTGLVGIGHDITERKTAEEALLESEEKYRLIFENSPMGLLYYDEKGVIVACNTGFAQIIGTSVEKLVGLNMLILPDKKMVSAIRKSIEGETALFEGTYQSVTANKISKGRALFAPIKFTDGRIRGGVGIIEDITERRLAEEALLQSQERARLQRNAIARIAVDEGISSGNYKNFFQRLTEIGAGAIQIARVSIWLLKNNRTELWCESLYESHSGNHSSGAILKILDFPTYFRAIDHESRISANDAVNDLRTREFASDYLLPNQISSMLDAGIYVEGELMGVVCLEHTGEKRNWHPDEEAFASTLAAITAQALANAKRRLFEEALRVSEEKYRSIFENVQDVFFQTDLSGRILEISPSITRFSGYERADVIGTKVSGLYFNPDNQEELVDTIKEKQELRDYELRLITKSGLTKYISVNASLVPGADGIPQYIEGSVRDISERKQAAEELNERKEKYRGLSEATFEAIFISEKGLCIEQNLSAEKMFGYTSEEAIGRLGTEWMVPEDREMIMDKMISGYEFPYEATALRKDGTTFPCMLTGKMMHYKGKSVRVTSVSDISDRKRAENALRESEEKYRHIFENVQDVFFQTDLNGIITEISPSIKHFSEFDRFDLIGSHVDELYYQKEDRPIMLHEIKQKGELRDYELGLRTRNGEKRFVSLNASMITDSDGKLHHIDGSIRDITERKLAEEKIRKIGQHYQALIEKAPDGVVLINALGNFTFVSPSAKKMFGYAVNDEVTGNPAEYTHPDDLEMVLTHMGRLFQDPSYIPTIQYRFTDKKGNWKWVESTMSNLLADTSVEAIVINFRDIDERKQAEAELIKSTERNKTILRTAMDGFLLLDMDGRILEVNETFCAMSGYSEAELLLMRIPDLEVKDMAIETASRIHKVIENGEHRFESRQVRKDGRIFDVEVSIQYQPNEDGRAVAFLHDITDRKLSEEELIHAKERAEESDRLKSAFLANMSHEIRTPMNGILGFTDLLRASDLSGEQKDLYIGVIQQSGSRMLNIINDIIDISKIESGQVETTVSETNINEQVEFIYSFFKPEATQKGLNFQFCNTLPSKEANIVTDREKVYAILTNLVKNAIKFTHKGYIEFGYAKKGNTLEFFVKDSGIGIPDEKKGIIFKRFRQGSESLTRNYEGAGLGLSISDAYVNMLGGEIRFESEAGIGSAFYFTIPYQPAPESATDRINLVLDEGTPTPKPLKILIAEDDEISEMLIAFAVRFISREILVVRTGIEAVEACRNNPDLDLVLMDIKLPELSGYEAVRRIREFNTAIVIIAQTAFGLVDDREKALAAGCDDYISKPIDVALLKGLIQLHFQN